MVAAILVVVCVLILVCCLGWCEVALPDVLICWAMLGLYAAWVGLCLMTVVFLLWCEFWWLWTA